MWLLDIFAREFGFSDVQSNYSRVYAWMANQLGHMTLGLATVLFFIWIVETTYAFSYTVLAHGGGLAGWWTAFCVECVRDDCPTTIGWSLVALVVAAACLYFGRKLRDRRFDILAALIVLGVAYGAYVSGCPECWNFTLMTAGQVLTLGVVVFLIVWSLFQTMRRKDEKEAEKARLIHRHVWEKRALAMPDKMASLSVAVFALIGLYLTSTLLPTAAEMPAAGGPIRFPTPRDQVMIFSVGAATCLFAVACAVLCKDVRFIALFCITLFASFMIATDGAPFPPPPPDASVAAGALGRIEIWSLILAIGFVTYAFVVMFGTRRPPEAFTSLERWVQLATNIVIGSVIYYSINYLEDPEWRFAIAGALASLTLWWIKEFASDLPNVHKEIAEVALRRPNRLLGRCGAMEKEYFRDARIDARSDGVFYFAGAWIAAGAVTESDVLPGVLWRSGSEIFGLILFVALFLLVGKNWAYRQLALDLMGAYKASRFAVFRSRLWLASLDVSRDGQIRNAGTLTPLANPLLKLRDFAIRPNVEGVELDKEDRDEAPAPRFDHLIVFGGVGSGRSPLARAIASEAALADWPTRFQVRCRAPVEAGRERKARYITGDRLAHYWDDVSTERDIGATPTVPYLIEKTLRTATLELPEGAKPEDWETCDAAGLVAIDDIGAADISDDDWLDESFKWLDLASSQQTVWLIHKPYDGDEPTPAAFEALVAEATPLIQRLAAETVPEDRGADALRIAIAVTQRHVETELDANA